MAYSILFELTPAHLSDIIFYSFSLCSSCLAGPLVFFKYGKHIATSEPQHLVSSTGNDFTQIFVWFFHHSIQVSAFKCHHIREDFVDIVPPNRSSYQSSPEISIFPPFLLYFSSWHSPVPDIIIYSLFLCFNCLSCPLECKFLAIKTLSCSLLYFPCLEECLAHNRNSMSLLHKWMNPGSYNSSV